MEHFSYNRADSLAQAISMQSRADTAQQGAKVRFLAGGTTLIDLMKLNVEQPDTLVDLRALDLKDVSMAADGGLTIGALVKNAALAQDPNVKAQYAVLSEALLSGASPQLRNMATTAGNLLQRTRCMYFRDTAMPCNKRSPGSGCAARTGMHRNLAILGTSEDCLASNPSDMNVALMALDATVQITGASGKRSVPIDDFFLLPGHTPNRENVLTPGDVVTHITLPPTVPGAVSLYLKLRDRASYEFALSSAAVELVVEGNLIRHVRIALGGVGTKPWRARRAEQALIGKAPERTVFRAAADAELAAATPLTQNAFKVELAARCLTRALTQAVALATKAKD